MTDMMIAAKEVVSWAIDNDKLVGKEGLIYDIAEIIEIEDDFIEGFQKVVVIARDGETTEKFEILKDKTVTLLK